MPRFDERFNPTVFWAAVLAVATLVLAIMALVKFTE